MQEGGGLHTKAPNLETLVRWEGVCGRGGRLQADELWMEHTHRLHTYIAGASQTF